MALFYATDFYDQLENRILPALRAGSVVLADRYIFTLMARDMARGAPFVWLEPLYSMAVIPVSFSASSLPIRVPGSTQCSRAISRRMAAIRSQTR